MSLNRKQELLDRILKNTKEAFRLFREMQETTKNDVVIKHIALIKENTEYLKEIQAINKKEKEALQQLFFD